MRSNNTLFFRSALTGAMQNMPYRGDAIQVRQVEQPAKPIRSITWERENATSSSGHFRSIVLEGLDKGSKELFGKLVEVNGMTKLGGIFNWLPFRRGSSLTQDGFDQVTLYHSLNEVQHHLSKLGFDVPQILAKRHGGNGHPVRAHANAVNDLNAWYSPQGDDLTFGRGAGKWHLAEDSDVTVHEFGHLLLDHIVPHIGGEGGAIHEAFGDALASLHFDDPEVAEDFPVARGKKPSKTAGLRNVNNQLTLNQVGSEVHERSQPYSGFFWSLKSALTDPNGPFVLDSRTAADTMLRVLITHAYHYPTMQPSSTDFVDAVLKGSEALANNGKLGVDWLTFRSAILQEAEKRALLSPTEARNRRLPTQPMFLTTVDLSTIMNSYGSHIRFRETASLPHQTGSTVKYQEEYLSPKYGAVPILKHGMIVQRDRQGNVVDLSMRDIRMIDPHTIDESINVDYRTALTRALENARKRAVQTASRLKSAQQQGVDPLKLNPLLMNLRVAQKSWRTLETLLATIAESGALPKPQLVMLSQHNGYHYEILTGMERFYVDARTGEVSTQSDVFVN